MKIAIICSYDFSIAWSLEVFVKKLLLKNQVTVICDIHEDTDYGYYRDQMVGWGVKHKLVKDSRFISPLEDFKYLINVIITHNENK